jgi:hypothetical protein
MSEQQDIRERLVQFALKLLRIYTEDELGLDDMRRLFVESGFFTNHGTPQCAPIPEIAALLPKPLEVRMAEALAMLVRYAPSKDYQEIRPRVADALNVAAEARAALDSGRWKDVQP